MKKQGAFFLSALLAISAGPILHSQATSGTVPVHMVVTAESTKDSSSPGDMDKRDVVVRLGRDRAEVSDWIPARGDQAGLQLFILIDDTSNTQQLGSHLDEVRSFISAQPATTLVAIGYMRNANVTIVQDFTADHAKAAQAVRLPLGSLGASDSPYLSLISLISRWPASKVRREVVMITDGIDRLRGFSSSARGPSTLSARGPNRGMASPAFAPAPMSMPYISPDIDRASTTSQRFGVIIHTIYTPGVGRADRNFFEANNGLNGISKLSDETGGESFSLALAPAVSFQPYFDRLQTILNNQYFLVFQAQPGRRAGLQRVRLSTEVPDVEFAAADNVWVPTSTGSEDDKQ
jgi:hypothetical protein